MIEWDETGRPKRADMWAEYAARERANWREFGRAYLSSEPALPDSDWAQIVIRDAAWRAKRPGGYEGRTNAQIGARPGSEAAHDRMLLVDEVKRLRREVGE